jgi:hypothetical protein
LGIFSIPHDHDSLILPTMPNPLKMLYYVVHPSELRSMIQW